MNANELADELDSMLKAIGLIDNRVPTMLRQQQVEIEYWKEKFNKAMVMQEVKPAKYTDAWWKEVEEFNKRLKVQEK
jgi:hypothetical protein